MKKKKFISKQGLLLKLLEVSEIHGTVKINCPMDLEAKNVSTVFCLYLMSEILPKKKKKKIWFLGYLEIRSYSSFVSVIYVDKDENRKIMDTLSKVSLALKCIYENHGHTLESLIGFRVHIKIQSYADNV